MDFTHAKYEELCKAMVDSDCTPVSVCTYLGVKSTYYFRMKKGVFEPDMIKKIVSDR